LDAGDILLPRCNVALVASVKFHVGYYRPTETFKLPEFMLITKAFFIDIDFTPLKQGWKMNKFFPFGWCGAVGFPGEKPPWKYHFHTSLHAWHGEPDRIDVKINNFSWHHDFSEGDAYGKPYKRRTQGD
jgi:hypothetical protein